MARYSARREAILEVACGTGGATVLLARALGARGRIQAVDLTPGMLKKARAKLIRQGLVDCVELRLSPALALPFADNSFDLLYNSHIFDLIDLSEIPSILAEFKMVLKLGSRLVLMDMSKDTVAKTRYERLYEKGLLSFASGACRLVVMRPVVETAGFTGLARKYRRNRSLFPLNWLYDNEIVVGRMG
ncbi:hypothetical protein DFAR_3190014 [Desulfarculales bacterium]